MLIVAGHFEVDPERREEFIREREETMRKSRAEPGCIAYAFMADPIEPARVQLFERWENKDALATHLAALRSAPRPASDIKILGAEVLQYEVGEVGPVGS
ncbi:MAG TPA: antibiotic biosynthesis monooxygenase [Acidimicrobiales bacterium]|nr:antibiotic biosynthesis monooxygenase [Acidimicrobiales bacterium]